MTSSWTNKHKTSKTRWREASCQQIMNSKIRLKPILKYSMIQMQSIMLTTISKMDRTHLVTRLRIKIRSRSTWINQVNRSIINLSWRRARLSTVNRTNTQHETITIMDINIHGDSNNINHNIRQRRRLVFHISLSWPNTRTRSHLKTRICKVRTKKVIINLILIVISGREDNIKEQEAANIITISMAILSINQMFMIPRTTLGSTRSRMTSSFSSIWLNSKPSHVLFWPLTSPGQEKRQRRLCHNRIIQNDAFSTMTTKKIDGGHWEPIRQKCALTSQIVDCTTSVCMETIV